MTEIFLKLLNMSISASWLVLAVIVLRFFLKKTPKWITCLLWCIVALRLVMPFTIESGLSLIPSAEVIPQDIITSQIPAIHSGIPAVNSAVNPMVTQQVMAQENILEKVLSVGTLVWVIGAVGMLLYGVASWLLLRHRVKASIPLQDRVYMSDNVDSPFVFGFFSPKIYVPSGMPVEQTEYVLAHERAHIRRGDHCWKPLSYWLLCVYWFNPLLWLAYILLCRDIERACDEKVIAKMDNTDKKGYSQALIACSVHRRMIMACPVAFGEIGVKERIKGVLSYKKPTVWILAAAMVACAVTAVCFLTNPETCPHLYKSEITVAATCTQKGLENRTCQLCKHSYTAPVEVCAHSYDDGVVVIAPTCIARGELERTCTGCGAKTTEPIEMTAHIDGEHIISKEPNCTEKGEVTTVCTYCQAVYVVEILPENDVHDFVETVITESTCTQNGEGIKTCTRCEHSEAISYEKAEHSFVYLGLSQATCHKDGYETWSCTVCHYSPKIKVQERREHEWVWASNRRYQYCRYCGDHKYSSTSLLPTGNKPSVPELPVINLYDPVPDPLDDIQSPWPPCP